jgi:hypothetical protein
MVPWPAQAAHVTMSTALDHETRRLYESLRSSSRHGPFIRAVEQAPRSPRMPIRDTVLAIGPAALYKEFRRSGADGRRLREAAEGLGLPVDTIPLKPAGTLTENGAIILKWLRTHRDRNIVLVSLSKGGADVKKALAMDSGFESFHRVSAWISVGGLMEGTPLAQWLLSKERIPSALRAINRLAGVDLTFLREVDRRSGGPLDFDLTLPAHLRLVHVLGFPQQAHASNWLARAFHRRLAEYGPNDGFMLLGDCQRWPGLIYPLWGADHYFRTREDLRPLLERLLTMAVEPSRLDTFFDPGP